MDVDVPFARQQLGHLGWREGGLAVHPAGQRAFECQRHARSGTYRGGTMKVARNGDTRQPPVRQLPAQQPGGFVKHGIDLPRAPGSRSTQGWHLVRAREHGAEGGQVGSRLLRRRFRRLAGALGAGLSGGSWGAAGAQHPRCDSRSDEPGGPPVQRTVYMGQGGVMRHAGLRLATAVAKTGIS